jgi:hypothetical protein
LLECQKDGFLYTKSLPQAASPNEETNLRKKITNKNNENDKTDLQVKNIHLYKLGHKLHSQMNLNVENLTEASILELKSNEF